MDRPLLRVLSLDGGGIRGLSSLLILETVMERLREKNGLDQVPRPCEWFDLIGGTSTGGIIAIMLGKLGMTIDECIRAYKKVAQQAFTPKSLSIIPGSPSGSFSAKQLEAAIKNIVRENCINPACVDERKRGEATAETCPHGEMQFRGDSYTKTVVLAITKDNIDALPTLFKTYDTSASLDGCTVWQVARATSAATTFFKPIEVGRDQIKFIDAGFGYNNPCEVLIREAKNQFPDRNEMRVLSIGTGLGDVVSIKDTRMSILKALKKMATTSKKIALSLDEQYGGSETYYRFNVERGLEDISLSDWDKSSTISSHTHNYLNENRRKVDKFVQSLTQTAKAEPSTETGEIPVPGDTDNTTVHSIPFDENRNFTGRKTIIDTITDKLFKTKGCNRVALLGLGGAGKTQIALHMAHWAKENVGGCSVFWIPAFSIAGFEQECVQLVKSLRISCTADQDAKEVVQQHFNSGALKRWFMVVDNVDDMEVLRPSKSSNKGIWNFLPKHPNGRILFTTRSRNVALELTSQVVLLSHMDFNEASNLLEKLLVHANDEIHDKKVLTKLFEVLTYLPLAIAQAAAYINMYETPISEYIDLCDNTDQRNIMELFEHSCDNETYNDKSQSAVATTWFVSFDRIRSSNQSAADLLSFMAFIEPKAIPRSILPTFETEQQLLSAIGTLKGHGFLSQRGLDSLYDMHRLVHLATRRWIEQSGDSTRVQQMTLQRLSNIFPTHNWRNHELWRLYLPHALRLLRNPNKIDTKFIFCLNFKVAKCLLRDSRGNEALAILEYIVSLAETTLSGSHELQRNSIRWLAIAYEINGESKKAVEILENLVEVEAQALPKDNQGRLFSQQVLGSAYLRNCQVNEAAAILKSVAEIQDSSLAPDNVHRLYSQYLLAEAYIAGSQPKEAINILEPMVTIHSRIFGNDNPDRLTSQQQLAHAYMETGQVVKAVEILQSVVEIKKRILTEDNPDRLTSQQQLAHAYMETGQVVKAVEILQSVVEIKRRILTEDNPKMLSAQHLLARAYINTNQPAKAVEILQSVMEIEKRILTEDDPILLSSKNLLAQAYININQSVKAVEILQSVMEIEKRILTEDDLTWLLSKHLLAHAYINTNQSVKAVEILQSVVEIKKRILTEDDPILLSSKHLLARAYINTNQSVKAVEILEHVVMLDERTLAKHDMNQLASRQMLASAYYLHGQTDQAIRIIKDVITIRTKTTHKNDPKLRDAKVILQRCHGRLKKSRWKFWS